MTEIIVRMPNRKRFDITGKRGAVEWFAESGRPHDTLLRGMGSES
jgi:hypothetical protein